MIGVTLHDVEAAEAELIDGLAWVVLRFAGGDRVTIHTVNFTQAVAVADAFMSEIEARLDAPKAD